MSLPTGIRTCGRCDYTNPKTRKRCGNRTCKGRYCAVHARIVHGVVSEDLDADKHLYFPGIRAAVDLPAGTQLPIQGAYGTLDEIKEFLGDPGAGKVVEVYDDPGTYLYTGTTRSGIGRYALGRPGRQNAVVTRDPVDVDKFFVTLTDDVGQGDRIVARSSDDDVRAYNSMEVERIENALLVSQPAFERGRPIQPQVRPPRGASTMRIRDPSFPDSIFIGDSDDDDEDDGGGDAPPPPPSPTPAPRARAPPASRPVQLPEQPPSSDDEEGPEQDLRTALAQYYQERGGTRGAAFGAFARAQRANLPRLSGEEGEFVRYAAARIDAGDYRNPAALVRDFDREEDAAEQAEAISGVERAVRESVVDFSEGNPPLPPSVSCSIRRAPNGRTVVECVEGSLGEEPATRRKPRRRTPAPRRNPRRESTARRSGRNKNKKRRVGFSFPAYLAGEI